jgi:hypothetical protein
LQLPENTGTEVRPKLRTQSLLHQQTIIRFNAPQSPEKFDLGSPLVRGQFFVPSGFDHFKGKICLH